MEITKENCPFCNGLGYVMNYNNKGICVCTHCLEKRGEEQHIKQKEKEYE